MCIPREHSATAQWSFLTSENADQLRTRFTIPGPRSSAPLPKNADMPLSSRAGKVLATAFDHAGDRWVTTLDLLWAMLGDDQQQVAESINAVGINREQIDQEIRRSRGRHKPGFEEFSGAARRSIFFARFEAGRLGFDEIDTPHLLLGLLLENAGERDFIRHLSSISEEISEDRISIPREHSATAQWPFL